MAEENAGQPNAGSENNADAQNHGGSSKKLLIIAFIAGLFLSAGGGAAAYLLLTPATSADEHSQEQPESPEGLSNEPPADPSTSTSKAPKEEASKTDSKDAAPSPESEKTEPSLPNVNFGNTFTFKTFHLNLGNPLENHYIRLEIAVEYKGGEAQRKEIEQRLPQLRDAVVGVASRKTREFLLGPDGKDQLRREILIRMNRYMSQPLESVFLTDILIE